MSRKTVLPVAIILLAAFIALGALPIYASMNDKSGQYQLTTQ